MTMSAWGTNQPLPAEVSGVPHVHVLRPRFHIYRTIVAREVIGLNELILSMCQRSLSTLFSWANATRAMPCQPKGGGDPAIDTCLS
jgi:hypothetical protein